MIATEGVGTALTRLGAGTSLGVDRSGNPAHVLGLVEQ